ncbi:unnamed protein product [Cyclocybe aegerita]|uniref:F-box domain-containing protein n=1 Tax=Cyclocybe aegerita TaxID=1973307 RepID=A0A8S0WVG5_CYCAE|nr:unnamed protein product [Cyclocybe aegerita]
MLLTDISPFAVLKFFETIKSLIADLAPEDSSLQPPFPALLRSNEPPSDEEAQVVTAFVATLDGRWATVAPHQETLTYMSPSREEERIQSLISSHKSIISACRRIPNEIWHDIFVLAAEPTVFYAEQNIKLKRRKTPWRISGVCRRWRAVAISTPRLWTHIFLESSDRNVDITGPPGYLSKLLERSKTFPLSVSIVHSTSLHTEQKGLVKLFQHCERWKHLHLTAPVGWAKLFQDNVKGKLYSLESLDIQFNSLAGSIVDFDAFEDAPKLYEVRINDERAIRIHLPWSQLARLQLPGRQSYSLDKITHASGYLSSFSLRFVEQLPVKPLPRVVDFSMTGPGPDVDNWNITQVFPSLRTLSIVRPYGTELLNQIISQLQFVSLQCLTLKDIIMDSQDNRLQLPNLKTLKVLRIDLLGKEELVKLAVEEHSGALRILPSLEDLHFFIPWPMESKLTELHYTDQSDLYSVLNAVGRTRCERLLQSDVGPTTDNMTPLSAPFCIPTTSNRLTGPTLKSLRLQFAARYLKPITWPNDCNLQEQVESGWREKDFRTIPAWKEETPALALWARSYSITVSFTLVPRKRGLNNFVFGNEFVLSLTNGHLVFKKTFRTDTGVGVTSMS